jgi:uncharacterized membrane-anchored protein
VAEGFGIGYLQTGLIFGAIIGLIAFAYYFLRMGSILAFWLAYILTRPLGASIGDFFSQPAEYGGLGFGATVTSFIFIGCIAAVVLYMSVTHEGEEAAQAHESISEEDASGARPYRSAAWKSET